MTPQATLGEALIFTLLGTSIGIVIGLTLIPSTSSEVSYQLTSPYDHQVECQAIVDRLKEPAVMMYDEKHDTCTYWLGNRIKL